MTRHVGPTIAGVLVSLALVVAPANAFGPSLKAEAAKAKACKASKVPVTIGKKTTCQPLATAIPQPKVIDIRLAHLQEALKLDPAKAVKGKKRKRARTLQSGFGAAGKRAQKKLLKMLPKVLAFVDRKGGGARSSSRPAGPALASSSCDVGPAGPTGHAAGGSLGALGDNGGYIETSAGGGLRVRVTFVSCKGANNWAMPPCPTANGSVDGSATGEFRVTIEIWDGTRLVSRNSNIFQTKAKAHGEVGPDAKLKFVEIEHTEEVFIVATGPSVPVVIRGGVTRSVKIPLPGGKLDPAAARVRYFGDTFDFKSGAEAFASSAASALGAYEYVEPNWSTFNPKGGYCAEPVFTPDSNTLKLKKGDTNQLGIYAKARQDGGRATDARWTLLNQTNADFSPASSEGPAANVSYTVTKAPPKGEVKVTVKFTSTAGVGEKSWTQPVEETTITQITGSFGGESWGESPFAVPSRQQWTGAAHFQRLTSEGGASGVYVLTSGNISIDLSGTDQSGATGCQQSGSASEPLTSGSVSVTGTGPANEAPYRYALNISMPFVAIKATRHDCPKAAQEAGYEGSEFDATPVWKLDRKDEESADGLAYVGVDKQIYGSSPFIGWYEENWTFQGMP
jgi:hypothetical protein